MSPRELPEYLRPVPGPEGGSNPAAEPVEPSDAPKSKSKAKAKTKVKAKADGPAPEPVEHPEAPHGLIAPTRRGHSGAFVTDAIVDLGYASRELVDQSIAQSRTAGRSP